MQEFSLKVISFSSFYATLQYGKFPFDYKNTLLCHSTRLCPVGMTWMPIPLFDSKMQTSLIDVVPCFFAMKYHIWLMTVSI